MAKDRQKNAYIRDESHLDYTNLDHYERALNSSDINWEEYYVQSVMNAPSHALNLKREIFQKKVRHKISNKLGIENVVFSSDAAMANNIRSQEALAQVQYSKVSDVQKLDDSAYSFEPDVKTSLMYMLEEIIIHLDSDQLKVLSYFIVSEKIDTFVVEDFRQNTLFDELRTYVLQVWDLDVTSINALNEFIGSKYRAEIARKSLCRLLKEKFPLLLKI